MSYKRGRGVRRIVSATVRTGAAGRHGSGDEGSENLQDMAFTDGALTDTHYPLHVPEWCETDVSYCDLSHLQDADEYHVCYVDLSSADDSRVAA